MTDWLVNGLEEDVRPRMFEAIASEQPFALATIVSAEGGPRPVGSQMFITADHFDGFLSGGCIEPDVVGHAREVLSDGAPRRLLYGQGSPFIDIRLPCGGYLEVLVERVLPDDVALRSLHSLTRKRTPALWKSNGRQRWCGAVSENNAVPVLGFARLYTPPQRLAVVGTDPFALAIAGMGQQIGWETTLLAPFGPSYLPPFGIACDRGNISAALARLNPDQWTALAVATHEIDADVDALAHALPSDAGYVGLLGSRRRVPEVIARLRLAGLTDAAVSRLRAPIGLPIAARSPWEVAVAVTAQVIATTHKERISETGTMDRLTNAEAL